MILVDSNIFLEVLLKQEKFEVCKRFLQENEQYVVISDFTIYTIGIKLLFHGLTEEYEAFVGDAENRWTTERLPFNDYSTLLEFNKHKKLDFDDAYQASIAFLNRYDICTLDADFNSVKDQVKVIAP